MYGSIEARYKNDKTFNRAVDILRAFLKEYQLTPSELREAAVLASTMHVAENVNPLFIYDKAKLKPYDGYGFSWSEYDWTKADLPAFSYSPADSLHNWYNRFTTTKPVPATEERQHVHYFHTKKGEGINSYRVCGCGISNVYYQYSSDKQTKV
jgi:hypothetical protein